MPGGMLRRCVLNTGAFEFESGGSLPGLELAYHCSGREYRKGEKVVWICHALTANSDPEDWWPQMVGPGKFIDPEKCFVVCVNMLCSPYGSSGPASTDPSSGQPYLMRFPKITIRDIVAGNILVRKHLGIDRVDVLIGPSIGGFQAYEWAVTEPELFSRVIFLATTDRCTPYMTAFNESQRMALLSDPTFGEAASLSGGKAGLACARSIAMLSYRTFEGYNRTQSEADPDTLFADRAASYQRYQGKKLADRFDAYSYWFLTCALDSHNIGRGRGGVDAALGRIKAKAMVINIDSDNLFPPQPGRDTASKIAGAEYHEMSSAFGHDGFLLEYGTLSALMAPFIL